MAGRNILRPKPILQILQNLHSGSQDMNTFPVHSAESDQMYPCRTGKGTLPACLIVGR